MPSNDTEANAEQNGGTALLHPCALIGPWKNDSVSDVGCVDGPCSVTEPPPWVPNGFAFDGTETAVGNCALISVVPPP